MEIQPRALLRQLIARPLNTTFPRQVSAVRSIYGPQLQIGFAPENVAEALAEPLEYYAERDRAYLADRVKTCIRVMERNHPKDRGLEENSESNLKRDFYEYKYK